MITASKLSFIWNVSMASFGIVFWAYGVLTLVFPEIFAPWGFVLAILGALFAIFFIATALLAGQKNAETAWDEGAEHDSNRAYKFGFTVACVVYFVFWFVLTQGWASVEAAFPAMGAFTGGSYCLFMGVTGLRGWYETRNSSD